MKPKMQFFTCSVCRLTFPVSSNAFGIGEISVCSQCYEKTSETPGQVEQESNRPASVEAGQDNNPKE